MKRNPSFSKTWREATFFRWWPANSFWAFERIESVRNYALRRFRGKTLPPMRSSQMESQLVDPFFRLVEVQAATTRKIAVHKQENRPMLNALRVHGRNFNRSSCLNLSLRKGVADQASHSECLSTTKPPTEDRRGTITGSPRAVSSGNKLVPIARSPPPSHDGEVRCKRFYRDNLSVSQVIFPQSRCFS